MISHKHKFIFVKLSKSASSSIEDTLKKVCHDAKFEKTDHHHILDMISDDTVNYYKFTTIRNPYARLVSRFFYAKTKKHKSQFANLSFSDFVKGGHDTTPMNTRWVANTAPHLKKLLCRVGFFDNQIDWIKNSKNKVLVDFVIKVESLQADFNTLCDKIRIPHQQLPHTNKTKHKHYTEYYDDETREIVAKKYKEDIEYFNYKFGE